MGQTRKERKLRSSSFTAFWIVWMIKVKAHTGLRLAWFWGAPTSQNLPRIPTPHSQVTECTCPSSTALASDKKEQTFLFLSCLQIWLPAGACKPAAGRWQLLPSPQNRPFHRRETNGLTASDLRKPSQNSSSLYLLLRYNYGWQWLTGSWKT